MRVIGGKFKSRRLKSIPGLSTRPTPDRLRETLFDILGRSVQGAVFLDAYAGTGAVGIEALSRGASRAIFLERSKTAANVIEENLRSLSLESRAAVILTRARAGIASQKADMVFLDPPYNLEAEYQPVLELLAENPPQLTIAQHSVRFALAESYGALHRTRMLKQGDNALSFYAPSTLT